MNNDFYSTLSPQGCLYTWGVNNHAQLGLNERSEYDKNRKHHHKNLFVNYDVIQQRTFSDRNKVLNQLSNHNGPFHATPTLVQTVSLL